MSNVRIANNEGIVFADRIEAALLLCDGLDRYKGKDPVVLGIPRGGMVIAKEVSRELNGSLDIMLTRKLRAPYNPEFAIGAVSENGKVFLNKEAISFINVGEDYLNAEKKEQMEEIERRVELYRSVLKKIPLRDRYVIITDDGVATGSTMLAALWSIRQENPAKIICAVPVGASDSVNSLSEHADEIFCLSCVDSFTSVSQFYRDFGQVTDQDVMNMLKDRVKTI